MPFMVDIMHNTTTATPTTATPTTATPSDPNQVERTRRIIEKQSFAVLSTVSERGVPHAAGVIYAAVDDRPGPPTLFVHTMRSSRKARNIEISRRVGVVIPIRRLPIGPPFSIQFAGRASLLAMDDPEIGSLLAAGALGTVSGHGALDEPDGCFVRIEPGPTAHTYGIGVSVIALARDPLHAGGRVVSWGTSQTPVHPDR